MYYCIFSYFSVVLIFFFKQKTAYEMRISDWSSDVCSSDLKTLVMDFIKEANVKGIWYNKVNQLAAGLSKNATDTLDLWKKYWDNHYYFENVDHTRSLSNAGYKKYVNPSDDTNLWARSAEHTSELQSLMRISYTVFCLNKNI